MKNGFARPKKFLVVTSWLSKNALNASLMELAYEKEFFVIAQGASLKVPS